MKRVAVAAELHITALLSPFAGGAAFYIFLLPGCAQLGFVGILTILYPSAVLRISCFANIYCLLQ